MKTGVLQRYLKDLVYGANDGIITTFAVVASVEGAGLGHFTVLVIGIASLVADGLSMASSDYLGSRSGQAANRRCATEEKPRVAAALTFVSFVSAGSLPLFPYLLIPGENRFLTSALSTLGALLFVGAFRTRFTSQKAIFGALEMASIGGAAALAAYFLGEFTASFLTGFS